VRKTIVNIRGVVAKTRNEIEKKRAGNGKKVGIPPKLFHTLADVRPYL
jgi:hypothetical protein